MAQSRPASPQPFTAQGKPKPPTAKRAIALVRANPDTANDFYKREVAWVAEWRGDRWWVVGAFESLWGKRFAVDAAIIKGRVRTDIHYAERPTRKWVKATVARWGLSTLYTRLSTQAAIELVQKKTVGLNSGYTVLDAAAKLARDTARSVAWYFVLYVQRADGTKLVLPVTSGSGPLEEGNFIDGYGFGSTSVQQTVPANLTDWIRSIARARGWTPVNL